MKTIGKKIKEAMLDLEITQEELAKKLNLKQAQISKWITASRKPKLSNLAKIAKALNKPTNYFLEESPYHQYVGDKNKNVKQVINAEMDLKKEIETLNLKLDLLLERQKNEKK